jgi:hypothetical protein
MEPAAVGPGAGIVQQFAGMKDNGVESRTSMDQLRRGLLKNPSRRYRTVKNHASTDQV